MTQQVLMLRGINHNMFGKRDPEQYGTLTLQDIDHRLQTLGSGLGVSADSYVSASSAA